MPEVIRVAIGTEPLQLIASEVLKHSIRSRTSREVEFIESWTPKGGWHPALDAMPKLPRGTKFNRWRWCLDRLFRVPETDERIEPWRWALPAMTEASRIIYLDADQVVLADIAELWESLPQGKAIACVMNAVGFFGEKKQPEPNKPQTSVMVASAKALTACMCRANPVHACSEGRLPYAALMQAQWIPPALIHELPPEWNHFGIHTPQTKLLHWSHVASQPYRNPDHPTAGVFFRELHHAVADGAITQEQVEAEAEKKNLHGRFVKHLRKGKPWPEQAGR